MNGKFWKPFLAGLLLMAIGSTAVTYKAFIELQKSFDLIIPGMQTTVAVLVNDVTDLRYRTKAIEARLRR